MRIVLLIAVNHPYYGQLACNLAASIRLAEPETKIAIAYDEGSIGSVQGPGTAGLFDYRLKFEREFYANGKDKHFGLLKCKLPELVDRIQAQEKTQITEVLYIDVDTLILKGKNLAKFWQVIQKHKFCMEFRGKVNTQTAPVAHKIGSWASIDSMKNKFEMKTPEVPNFTQSSWIGYHHQNAEARAVFTAAQKVFEYYHSRKLLGKIWYNTVPDELCFAIAMGITGFPVADNLDLCYFNTEPFQPEKRVILERYAMFTIPSAGGFRAPYAYFYDYLIGQIAAAAGRKIFTQFKAKKNLITPREYRTIRK